MFNLFYDCLPFELQHKILIWSSVSQIIEKRKLHRHNVMKPCFIYIFEKAYARKVPTHVRRDILFTNNLRMYWGYMLSGIDHIQRMTSPILFMKYMKHKTLIDMCITNGLLIKKNWSKQRLISCLIKI